MSRWGKVIAGLALIGAALGFMLSKRKDGEVV